VKWAEAGDWCKQRGMLQPVLKSLGELVNVNKQLQQRGFCKFNFFKNIQNGLLLHPIRKLKHKN
jgi:hypothetical protein